MMDVLGLERLRELCSVTATPCVSIYMPTHRAGPAARQDHIRLKNALGAAEEALLQRGLRRRDAEELLEPARALVDRADFWRRQGDGLALFLSPQSFQYLRLALRFDDLVAVGSRYHLKPLLPLLTGNGRFYVLCLSQNHVRFLEGSRESLREVPVEGMPASVEEGVNLEVKQHYFQKHLRDPSSPTERSEAMDAMLEPFLHRVDAAVTGWLDEKQAAAPEASGAGPERAGWSRPPLVLCGVARICTAFQHLSRYSFIAPAGVEGNPDELRPEQLHAQAWAAVKPLFLAGRQRAADRYRDLQGTDRGSQDLRLVLRAAHQGRVETLFVPLEEHVWGSFEAEPELRIEISERPDGEDLLDRAALEVLLHRGTVYAVPRAEMPGPGPLNAIFRY